MNRLIQGRDNINALSVNFNIYSRSYSRSSWKENEKGEESNGQKRLGNLFEKGHFRKYIFTIFFTTSPDFLFDAPKN